MGSSQSVQSSREVISRWHSEPKERLLFDSGLSEISQYLQAVDKIRQSNEHAGMISMAVARLKNEFFTVLTRQNETAANGPNSSVTELSSSITDTTSYQFRYEDYVVYEVPSREVIDYLKNIAERMDSCGHLDACMQLYITCRIHFLNSKIKRLRLEELQGGDKKRFLLEELKMKVARWIQAAKVCTKLLFPKEKQLAKQIFGGLGGKHEECFLGSVNEAAINLFTFAKAVSVSNQSSERLEVILILYEGLSYIMQDVNDLFSSESGKRVRDNAKAILSKLQDEIRRMIMDFENGVLNELSTISDDGGKVHSLSKYVMEFLDFIIKYRKILNPILSKPSMIILGKTFPDSDLQNPQNHLSHLSLHLILILEVLQLNLENKSNYFKDSCLGYLFMMNNVQYIVIKIQESKELQEMIGDEYLKKLTQNVKKAMINYQTLVCDRFLNCLKDEGLYVSNCVSSGVSKSILKKRMNNFNGVFEEIKMYQSSWEVIDLKLRDELCSLMLGKLMPAYDCFLTKFKKYLDSGRRNSGKNLFKDYQKIQIKYSIQDLQGLVLNDLFIRCKLGPKEPLSLTEVQ